MATLLEKFFLKLNITYLERKQKVWLWIKIVLLVIDVCILSWSMYGILDYYLHPEKEVEFNYQALTELHQKRAPQNLIILDKKLIPIEDGQHDAYFTIQNPNTRWLIKEMVYNVDLMQDNKVYARKSAKSFFEPQSQKNLIILGLNSKNINNPEIKISFGSLEWRKVFDYPKINLKVVDDDLRIQDNKTVYSGIIKNTSSLLLKEIRINVFLSSSSSMIALNQTFMRDLQVGESREFLVFWPKKMDAQKAETELEINPFNIKAPFTEEEPGTFLEY